jgi:hypothetical protein
MHTHDSSGRISDVSSQRLSGEQGTVRSAKGLDECLVRASMTGQLGRGLYLQRPFVTASAVYDRLNRLRDPERGVASQPGAATDQHAACCAVDVPSAAHTKLPHARRWLRVHPTEPLGHSATPAACQQHTQSACQPEERWDRDGKKEIKAKKEDEKGETYKEK